MFTRAFGVMTRWRPALALIARRRLALLACMVPLLAHAQSCPEPGASLVAVRNAINDMGKSDRAPAAAECAWSWAAGMNLEPELLNDQLVVRFFLEASDLHRRAFKKRSAAGRVAEADKYISDEIALRRQFLEAALSPKIMTTDDALRRATVRHLSSMAGALALRQQFDEVDKVLSNTPASAVDEEAVSVWLQAIWSCAKFDGKTSNLCTPENQAQCRGRISAFLSSVNEMKGRNYLPQTQRELQKLRNLAGEEGCLK